MKLIRGLHNVPKGFHCALSIGNFDGVHLGHRHVIEQLIQQAKALNLPSVVMVFEPQPLEFFAPEQARPRLTRFHEKIRALEETDVDFVICVRFNAEFSQLAPQAFVQQVLIETLGVRYLVVGHDFRFGAKRLGDFDYLAQASQQNGFGLAQMDKFELDGERVSSTQIRRLLAEGDLESAQLRLGRPYTLSGIVSHGQKLGRTIGFPTANIRLRYKTPVQGVFAVKVILPDGRMLAGMANVGTRPTLGRHAQNLEVHIFDLDEDLYSQHIEVQFCQRLRDEQKFDGLEALVQQIQRDDFEAKQWFESDRITRLRK